MHKKLLTLSILLTTFTTTQAQKIKTYAGLPYGGFIADTNWYDNTAVDLLSAHINAPYGVAIDTNGVVILSDYYNNKIRISSGGQLWNRAGKLGPADQSFGYADGATVQGYLSNPAGIAINPVDNSIIIADEGNHAIRRLSGFHNVSNAQILTTIAGDQSKLGLINGYGIAGSSDGNTGADAKFNGPADVAVDKNGNIYVADRLNHTIRKITPAGVVTTIAGKAGNDGFIDGTGASARFFLPTGICMEGNDSLLVADYGNASIRRVNLITKQVSTIAGKPTSFGGKDGSVATAQFANPSDILYVNGSILVADNRGMTVRMIRNNTVRTITGKYNKEGYADGQDTLARFIAPRALAFSKRDTTVYLAEEGNNILRTIKVVPEADFIADKQNVNVHVDVTLTNTSQNRPITLSSTWSITPSTYTIQEGSLTSDSFMIVSFNVAGSYEVKLIASNDFGMDAETRPAYILVSNVSGINTVQKRPLLAYPNPSNGAFTLGAAGKPFAQASIEITNMLGQPVYRLNNINGNEVVMNIQAPAGLYLVQVIENGQVSVHKIQITR